MRHIVGLLAGVLLLAGLGYFTRHYYWPYFQKQFAASQEYSRQEFDKLKAAQPVWQEVKFDASNLTNRPPINMPKSPGGPRPSRPRDKAMP